MSSESIIQKLFEDGLKHRIEEFEEEEKQKKGFLRGGSTGVHEPSADAFAGACHRAAFVRMKGIKLPNEDVPQDKELMFAGGRANEVLWEDALKRSWPGQVINEEDDRGKTRWETRNGIPVTGRPDIILADKDGNLELGIELKQVMAIWTARDVLIEGKPKFNHLCQAAHYSWQLDIPFELWYTNRVNFDAATDMISRVMPKWGTDKFKLLQRYLNVGFYKKILSKNGNLYNKRIKEAEFMDGQYGFSEGKVHAAANKILPFTVGFVLNWDNEGFLTWTNTLTKETQQTIISRERIRNFYEFVAKIETTEDLGPRPLTLKGSGEEAGYSQCGYCPMQEICDKHESNYSKWFEEVNHLNVNQKTKEI